MCLHSFRFKGHLVSEYACPCSSLDMRGYRIFRQRQGAGREGGLRVQAHLTEKALITTFSDNIFHFLGGGKGVGEWSKCY